MTAYVPVQCQDCGHVVPDHVRDGEDDDTTADAAVGLSEVEPAPDDETLWGLRGGWFRGRPRGSRILQLTCRACGSSTTRWYRSGHPRVTLNPHRWGRLCGEQEDLRLQLARYLGVTVRLCVPLDWDHVWSEFYDPRQDRWCVVDDSARNFALRLDEEGVGAWTRIWAIHPDATFCEDVTDDYLSVASSANGTRGRADVQFADRMDRYRRVVERARRDATGNATQAKTLTGYVLERAGFDDSERITRELRRAVRDYGTRAWWDID